jgi:hypothetical protein
MGYVNSPGRFAASTLKSGKIDAISEIRQAESTGLIGVD